MPTVLITGGSSGLGLETAKALLAKDYDVIITGRSQQKLVNAENKLNSNKLSWIANDISNFEDVESLAGQIKTIDLLINNAGQMGTPHTLSAQGHELQMATNHLGHFLLTKLLWEKLSKSESPRVIHLSSTVHRNGKAIKDTDELSGKDADYDRWQRYADTKLACTHFGRELDIRAKQAGSKVKSVIAHPGWASTGLQVHYPTRLHVLAQSPAQGARSQIKAALDPVEGGEFYAPNLELWGRPKKIQGNKLSRDLEVSKNLWELTEELTGKFIVS
jgi:NAD(P)-dependent dehydrogenase (short-subunit alcohol dehydrogenase family)